MSQTTTPNRGMQNVAAMAALAALGLNSSFMRLPAPIGRHLTAKEIAARVVERRQKAKRRRKQKAQRAARKITRRTP